MTVRRRFVLAVAAAALVAAGCATATTEDGNRAEQPTAAGAGENAGTVSTEQQRQAQELAVQAEKIMLDPDLAPREKYPKSLGMFRDALEIDPNNALAKQSITLIEDIYRSMGRPVPDPE
ncbi:MAG: hypothetical protein FGM52_02260 [Mycobacterium sp.]|nr:hypothetical protein [Mycobacterium sp.]